MKCAIYCRLSKEDDNIRRESESILNQKSMLSSYAAEKGWDIYKIYCDDDSSGADSQRPEFRAMLGDAEQKNFDIILCKTQSRFTRDLEMVEKYIHKLFPLWGIRFVAVLDNIDTETKGNKKARQINGLVNEWYLEDLSENIKAVFSQKRREGKYIASFAVYGYQKDPCDHNRLIVDLSAAETVRQIFSMYLSGQGTHKIAGILNSHGILPPMAYRDAGEHATDAPAVTAHGKYKWSATAVSRILKNEVYLGTTVQGMTRKPSYKSKRCVSVPKSDWVRVQNTHEPIIDEAAFGAAGRRLAARTRSDGHGDVYPLAGKLVCAGCGGGFIKVSHKYKGETKAYLQCKGYAANRQDPACTRHSIKLSELEETIHEKLRELVRKHYRIDDLKQFQTKTLPKAGALDKKELEAAQLRLERLSAAVGSLYLDKASGEISAELFKEISANISDEKLRLENRIEALKRIRQDETSAVSVRALLETDRLDRLLCDIFIDKIEIHEKTENSQRIKIYWRV